MSSILEDLKKVEAAEQRAENMPIINPDFQSLLDEQTEVSYKELRDLIRRDGIQSPIIVWQETNTLLDGHNRLKIAEELGIPFPRKDVSFPDEAAAREWIIRNQLGRRNLTPQRFEYFLGVLYNTQVQEAKEEAAKPAPDAKGKGKGKAVAKSAQKVAAKLATEHGVSAKTVRRAGAAAKGVDALARVKGKAAKAQQLGNKPTYTAEEMQAVGQASNTTVAAKTLEKIDSLKEAKNKKKTEDKKVAAVVKDKATYYSVVFTAPEFEKTGFNVTTEPKPTMDKDCMVYMLVPDEYLHDAMDLGDKWGLTYEATFVYPGKKPYDATYTKVSHEFVLMFSRGHPTGPKQGKEFGSVVSGTGTDTAGTVTSVMKIIDAYHNGSAKRLDMRRGVKPLAGWDSLS